jgi:nucleotide-binding universal stress UspA family protein
MYTKILVATDGSDYSRHALEIGVKYARHFGCPIELLHVVLQPMSYMGSDFAGHLYPYSSAQIKELGNFVMEKTTRDIDLEGVKLKKTIVAGHPASIIIEASKNGFDLVIMGTRGHGPLSGAVAGSVTQRVLADVLCPILVVK